MREDAQASIGRILRRLYQSTQALKADGESVAQLESAQILLTDWLSQKNRERAFSDHRRCSICERKLEYDINVIDYPGLVCNKCDDRAVTINSRAAKITGPDEGDNPVYIGGIKCWRRYRFGGYVTMRDHHRCSTLEEFYSRQQPVKQQPHQGWATQAGTETPKE